MNFINFGYLTCRRFKVIHVQSKGYLYIPSYLDLSKNLNNHFVLFMQNLTKPRLVRHVRTILIFTSLITS
jgi:hypothetical protein